MLLVVSEMSGNFLKSEERNYDNYTLIGKEQCDPSLQNMFPFYDRLI